MVPQDGFLFDASLADNIRYGSPDATDEDLLLALTELGLADWLDGLPGASARRSGSAASRCRRASASSSRWPAPTSPTRTCSSWTRRRPPSTRPPRSGSSGRWTVTRGRTAISIAHRLSTAEAADEVIVFEAGRIVQRGPHAALVAVPGVYADLHASWRAQRTL